MFIHLLLYSIPVSLLFYPCPWSSETWVEVMISISCPFKRDRHSLNPISNASLSSSLMHFLVLKRDHPFLQEWISRKIFVHQLFWVHFFPSSSFFLLLLFLDLYLLSKVSGTESMSGMFLCGKENVEDVFLWKKRSKEDERCLSWDARNEGDRSVTGIRERRRHHLLISFLWQKTEFDLLSSSSSSSLQSCLQHLIFRLD